MSQVLIAELTSFLQEADGVSGALVATTDGLLMAQAEVGTEPEVVAALASATAGLLSQFSAILGVGEAGGTVVQAAAGCFAIHPLVDNAVLLLYSRDAQSIALLHLAVRQAVPRLTSIIEHV